MALVVWLAILAIDFVLNGAVFAGLYLARGGFLLAPDEAFRRIPLGYAAFFILAVGLVELAYRLGTGSLVAGTRLGLVLGAGFGLTWSLSLYSIANLQIGLALAFGVVWLAVVAVGMAVAACGLGRKSLGGLALRVVALDVAAVVLVVTLQSLGWVATTTHQAMP